jgi:type I restriction enzyme S subunit
MVPNGWKAITLGDLVTYSAFGPRFSSDLYSENGAIGTIRTTDLCDEGTINYNTIPYANLGIDEFKSHILDSGDLLITRSGTCGIPCIFEKQDKPIIAGAFLIRFKLKSDVDASYLHYLLKYDVTQHHISKMASGGVQKNLTGTSLKKLKLEVPEHKEQRKIAKILSTWDKAISTTERLIDNSKQQKRALMQQLLTGKKRLLDDSGKPFEGEWEEVKLNTLCDIRRGASPRPIKDDKWFSNAGRGWIRIADVTAQKGQKLLATTQYLSALGAEKSVAVDPGDLIMSICGTIGVPKFLGIKACIHDGFVVFRNLSENLNLAFLYQYLILISDKLASDGQPGTQKNLNTTIVGNIMYPTISHKEQQKIASVLTNADKEIELLEEQLADLKQEKKALMQQLLTGKRRVKVDGEAFA